jgi:hypothetical protein
MLSKIHIVLIQVLQKKKGKTTSNMQYLSDKMSSSDPQPIKLCLLQAITEEFSEKMKIGSGGYGEVYKVGMVNHLC